MSVWGNAADYTPTALLRKSIFPGINKAIDSITKVIPPPQTTNTKLLSNINDDVAMSLVLWNESSFPDVQISCIHVLKLPKNQPSQNSSSFITKTESLPKINRNNYELCVFLGTKDGKIIYWLLAQDNVIQVNLLIPIAKPLVVNSAIVGIASGIDEWGQSMMISITANGVINRWELPNGVCNGVLETHFNNVIGMEVIFNARYALFYTSNTQMAILDIWTLSLLFCMDTSQEQIRQAITTAELKRVPIHIPGNLGQNSNGESFSTEVVDDKSNSIWDAITLSLGSEGLIKCFLWNQPVKSLTTHDYISNASTGKTGNSNSPRKNKYNISNWRLINSWLLSWADDGNDITCSQNQSSFETSSAVNKENPIDEVSNKHDDNHGVIFNQVNPQTWLMRSIKRSYFPIKLHLSEDCTLVLVIWSSKWAIFKRSWLCSTEKASTKKPMSKWKLRQLVGICRSPPSSFLPGNQEIKYDIQWQDGKFVQPNVILLWTTSGAVVMFELGQNKMEVNPANEGKLFLFTTADNHFVPRSAQKNLNIIQNGKYICSCRPCSCCNIHLMDHIYFTHSIKGLEAEGNSWTLIRVCEKGFTTAVVMIINSHNGSSTASVEIVQKFRLNALSNSTNTENSLAHQQSVSMLIIGRENRGSTHRDRQYVETPDIPNETHKPIHDVPIFTRGFIDGMVEISLFGDVNKAALKIQCHSGAVTALAYTRIPREANEKPLAADGKRGPSTVPRGVPITDSCLAGEHNVFFRTVGVYNSQCEHESIRDLDNLVVYNVFTAGADGVCNVIELLLEKRSSDVSKYELESSPYSISAKIVRSFPSHHARKGIKSISISPLINNGHFSFGKQLFATIGNDKKVTVYTPHYLTVVSQQNRNSSQTMTNWAPVEWCIAFEFASHNEIIRHIEWQLQASLLLVECEDCLVYVWSLQTGLLERVLPSGFLFGPSLSKSALNESINAFEGLKCPKVNAVSSGGSSGITHWQLQVGSSTIELIRLYINQSAQRIKSGWKSVHANNQIQRGSPYALGSIELLAFSWMLSYGTSTDIDLSCASILNLRESKLLYSWAVGDQILGSLMVPIPWKPHMLSEDINIPETSALNPTKLTSNSVTLHHWQHSSTLSAQLALGILTICANLMEFSLEGIPLSINSQESPSHWHEAFRILCSKLITHYSVVIPEVVPNFREPALDVLAIYGFHYCEYTQLAVRALLEGELKRLSIQKRQLLTAEYSAKIHWELERLEKQIGYDINKHLQSNTSSTTNTVSSLEVKKSLPATKVLPTNLGASNSGIKERDKYLLIVERIGPLALLLSMIGTAYPGEISPITAQEVCRLLVYLLEAPISGVSSVAAQCLSKGLILFRPHLADFAALIAQCLYLDMKYQESLRKQAATNIEDSSLQPCESAPMHQSQESNQESSQFSVATSLQPSSSALSLLVELGIYETEFVLSLLQEEMVNNERQNNYRESIVMYLMALLDQHYVLMYRHIPAIIKTILVCLDPSKPDRRRACLEKCTKCLHQLVGRYPMVDFHQETQRLAVGTMESVIIIYDLRTATRWRVFEGHTSPVCSLRYRSDGQLLISYAPREAVVRWWNCGQSGGLFGGMLKMQSSSCLKSHQLESLPEANDIKACLQHCVFKVLDKEKDKERKLQLMCLTREDQSQVQFLV